MKKLYSIIAMLFVGLATLSAQNTVFIGETGYGSLAEAVEAATDGATITIKGTTEITSRLSLSKNVTIVGETGAKIVGKCNGMNIQCKSGTTATLQNLTISFGLDNSITGNFVESSNNNSKLVFENVTFSGVKASKDIVCVKSNGTGEFSNVSFVDCELTNNACDIFVGVNKVTLKGSTTGSVAVENTRVNVADFTGKVEFFLVMGNDGVTPKHTLGSAMVVGSRDTSRFSIINAPEGYALAPAAAANKNEINLVQITPVVKNLTSNQTYGSFKEAMSSLEEGVLNELEILDNITTEERYIPANTQNVTISGTAGKDIVITRGGYNKGQTMFEANKGEKLTFKNLTLSGKGVTGLTQSIISCDGNGLYFENVTLADFATTAQGIIVVKKNGHAYFNGTTFAGNESNMSDVYVAAGGVMHITGDNVIGTITLVKENDSATGFGKIVMETASQANALAENPSKIILEGPWAIGNTIVQGCTDPSKFTLDYQINGKPASLVVKDGNLMLDDSTGIEDIFAGEENGPVDVYNMQGVLLKSNVDPANATEGLAKGVYIIGGKKVAVY